MIPLFSKHTEHDTLHNGMHLQRMHVGVAYSGYDFNMQESKDSQTHNLGLLLRINSLQFIPISVPSWHICDV